MHSLFFHIRSPYLILIIFALILLFIWLGYYLNKLRIAKYPEVLKQKAGAIEGSVLGIMSLLLGFTFSVVVSRFEARRQLIVDEITNINTAIFRCDLFPDSIRNPLRADFKEYLQARSAYYELGKDEAMVQEEIKKAKEISGRIWKRVVFDSQNSDTRLRSQQMIPALTSLINSIYIRDESRKTGVPQLILYTLLALVLITSFFLGANLSDKQRYKAMVLGYALVLALTLNLIIELNTPRTGLINLHATQDKMNELIELVK
jgi:hypothetical protein